MKKVVKMVFLLILCLSLFGCGPSEKNDDVFIKNLGKALEARWKITDSSNTNNMTNEEYRNHLSKAIQSEIDKLGNYEDYTFSNEKISLYAMNYIEALAMQKDGAQYYGIDDTKYTEMFGQGYINRCELIYLLNNESPLSVGTSYKDSLDAVLQNGKNCYEEDKKLIALDDMLADDLALEFNGDDYVFTLKNTTEYNYESVTLEFIICDSSGTEVNTAYVYLDNFKSGTTIKDAVYMYGNYDTVKVHGYYYRDYNNGYQACITNDQKVALINNYKIEIVLRTELPVEVKYSLSSGRVYTKCNITSFSYEEGYWSNGSASMTLHFSGEKTYDRDGDSNDSYCHFGWKLYNEDEVVVDSGSVYTDKVSVGEKFADATCYVSDLSPGTYYLDIIDN